MSSKSNSENKIRIVNVNYLNSIPYKELSHLEGIQYSETNPAECARMLHEDEADLALIPIAEYFSHGGYTALDFGIAAHNVVNSVFFFHNSTLEEIDTIYADDNSQTSILLLKVILNLISPKKKLKIFKTDIQEFKQDLKPNEGLLAIGDKTFSLNSRFHSRLDLSEKWHELTNLPFLFAVWAYRKENISASSIAKINKAIETGLAKKNDLAKIWAEDNKVSLDFVLKYINEQIIYPLDDKIKAGAERFRELASELNIFSSDTNISPKELNVDDILSKAAKGKRISIAEALELASKATLSELSLAADMRRKSLHHDEKVSYIIDRNINYTNVCNVLCRFCAFYRAPKKEGERETVKTHGRYLLTKEEIGEKIQETVDAGGIQILLQGGLNPELGIEYYEDLFRWIKANYPINLHALSADEILHITKVSNLSISEVFTRLIAAGLGSFPGGGAEILVDKVRQRIAPLKSPAAKWLETHRTAHLKGLTSTCTMMFGVRENWEDRINHLHKLRQLQDETAGFTAFITWPFQDDNLKLHKGDTSSIEYLRVQAISRLFLDNIDNIQSSWVTMGPSIGQVGLHFGANDFGSVMFEENVVSAAGTTYCINEEIIKKHINDAGFASWKRDVHYNNLS